MAGFASKKAMANDVPFNPIIRHVLLPMNASKPKYNFSRAKWYTASYGNHDVIEVFDWCEEHFGQCPEHLDAWCRWYSDRPWRDIIFRDEKDYNWFVLRWGT